MQLPATRLSRAVILLTAWVALAGAAHAGAQEPAETNAVTAIRALIGATWDKPDAKVVVDPVVVDGGYAIAGWTQEGRGGRALLKQRDAGWAVILCSGDPLKQVSSLQAAGVPAHAASRLAAALAAAEERADPARVALFSTFEGVMKMDATDAAHDHGGHKQHEHHH